MVSPIDSPPARRAPAVRLESEAMGDDGLKVWFHGSLVVDSTHLIWHAALAEVDRVGPRSLLVDAAKVDACDSAGLALLVELRARQLARGGQFEVVGLEAGPAARLSDFELSRALQPGAVSTSTGGFEGIGRVTVGILSDCGQLVGFAAALGRALLDATLHPRRVRWRDVAQTIEAIGVNALPIVVVINLMIGLIMAFEAGQALRAFGAEIFAADLVALAVLRELGPLMTAVVLTGRTGSAFAAELGTMKVGEEVSALDTMAIDPVRFLGVSRVLAAVITTPILTLLGNAFALLGGAVVFVLLDFPPITFVNQVQAAADAGDLWVGLGKSAVFGLLIAAVGCLRGLQTGSDAAAVGRSTTQAMVSGLFLVLAVDALFSILFNFLGI